MDNTEVTWVQLRYCDLELAILACRAETRRLERRNRTVIESILLREYEQLADALQPVFERRVPALKRVALHARGATISFLMEELDRFGGALAALIDSQDGTGKFTDDHMETLADLHTKLRVALLLASPDGELTDKTRTQLTKAELGDLR